ncbi:ROK family transcriptional regulator [Pseudalkalibacillus decolorationis]|uniref:ROK family transcriptional regulator n=1 Tax=Pseudalkalibacillus decolorationis TaxID=163879 RepID=UPI0021473D2F|nr:ROK family transcriptional regulator [Pseudalkalibacillus decolorationis]
MIKQFIETLSQKNKSLKHLYSLIREHGPVSKSELIERTGLKQTTCTRLIDELIEKQLIVESGLGESSGGRKPLIYQINPDYYYLFGVDISRTHTKVLLMDLNLDIKEEALFSMNEESTPEVTINFIENEIINMLHTHQLNTSRILGIGIGAIGPLDRENGKILNPIDFPTKGWNNVPIGKILSEKFDTKVLLDSGVNTAVVAEYKKGLDKEVHNIIYCLSGIGIRVGILNDGHLVHGPADNLGLFGQGHMVVNIHGRKCVCGSYGCMHAYSTIPAIKEEVIHSLKRGHDSVLQEKLNDVGQVTFSDICWAVQENDALCSHIVKDAAYYTGVGLSNIINILQPQLVILNGPIHTQMDLFYEVTKDIALKRTTTIYPGYDVQFSRGELGENAAAIGAGSMVFDYYL